MSIENYSGIVEVEIVGLSILRLCTWKRKKKARGKMSEVTITRYQCDACPFMTENAVEVIRVQLVVGWDVDPAGGMGSDATVNMYLCRKCASMVLNNFIMLLSYDHAIELENEIRGRQLKTYRYKLQVPKHYRTGERADA